MYIKKINLFCEFCSIDMIRTRTLELFTFKVKFLIIKLLDLIKINFAKAIHLNLS
jgi:hypothetical protein